MLLNNSSLLQFDQENNPTAWAFASWVLDVRVPGLTHVVRSGTIGSIRNGADFTWFAKIKSKAVLLFSIITWPKRVLNGQLCTLGKNCIIYYGSQRQTSFWWLSQVFQLLWVEPLALGICFTNYYSLSWKGFDPCTHLIWKQSLGVLESHMPEMIYWYHRTIGGSELVLKMLPP